MRLITHNERQIKVNRIKRKRQLRKYAIMTIRIMKITKTNNKKQN